MVVANRPRMGQPEPMPPLPLETAGATNPHDPGSSVAGERAVAVEGAAREPIVTRGGTTIRIGTASWTDPTMTAPGVFYPRGADRPRSGWPTTPATFPVVEIDATYYALPSRAGSRRPGWSGRRRTSCSTPRPTPS